MILDHQQQSAVKTTSPRALILAGAGSGKTRVLIERIAWLIETQKVSPTEIMAFSFTRKASGEIRDRLKERIGGVMAGGFFSCGTSRSMRLVSDVVSLCPSVCTR